MIVVNVVLDKKAKIIITAFIAVVIVLLLISMVIVSGETADKNAETATARLEFLRLQGYECDQETYKEITIPDSLDEVYIKYNKIQLSQGFDLMNYLGQKVDLYTYHVCNYSEDEDVYAHLLVKNGTIIGGDIASTKIDGFMQGIIQGSQMSNTEE